MAYGLIGLDIVLRLLLVEKKVAARWDPDSVGRVPVTAGEEFGDDMAVSPQPQDQEKAIPAAPDQLPLALRFVDENTIKDKVLLCALLALIGLFLSLTFPPIMAEISSIVEAKEKSMLAAGHPGFGPGGAFAQAYALFNVAFAGGCMVGPLLAGFIVQDKGWATMAWVLGLLSGITSLPAVLWLGGWLLQKTSD
ncbi:hypothetical protein N0V83_008112 [Neocucurbitaria cava]|uniref:MFS transporter n=1 Tax=Neocucurbitaria cava TaxID=798079 RepID=A0A9W8Y4G0_9PLEO|nr:hypothetical protein N0V83_008112 [Neocucurbitaria cava]